MENLKYSVIYEYEFHRGTSAAETARRINDVYGDGAAKENTVRFWFQRFRSGNFDLQNKHRGRSETKVDYILWLNKYIIFLKIDFMFLPYKTPILYVRI